MNAQNNQLDALAKRLGAYADQVGGGYPLVTIVAQDGRQLLLWQYARQDIIIDCTAAEIAAPDEWSLEDALILQAPSIETAFELVRRTERLRQQDTDQPYLRFGPMPGTTLDTKFLAHSGDSAVAGQHFGNRNPEGSRPLVLKF